MRELVLSAGVAYDCMQSGACCTHDWLIGVDDDAHARLGALTWPGQPHRSGAAAFRMLPFTLTGGERVTFAREPSGECVFLEPDRSCAIHRRLGAAAKPQVCREFPYTFVDTPDGVVVGVSFACTAVRARHGRSLADQRAEIEAVLAGSRRVQSVPHPVPLFGSIDIDWTQYRAIERGLLALLANDRIEVPTALLAGSVLISLCVGLTQVEARARREDRVPTESLVSGLSHLHAGGYDKILAVAAQARHPRRASLLPLAPLYTWLEISRRRPSRAGLVLALYRNVFRFRRGRGRVPDLITGGPPFDLGALETVGFDATLPRVGELLRRYWSHVVFRKTLTPMHGVFRGYQTMLALYAFTKWAARLVALRAGRRTVAAEDVSAAIALVEQRFVLHARFAEVFSLSPILTVLMERLYQRPSFVRGAALDPGPT